MQDYRVAIGKFCPYVEKSIRGILQFLILNPVIFRYVKTEGKTEYALTQAEATRIVVQILK